MPRQNCIVVLNGNFGLLFIYSFYLYICIIIFLLLLFIYFIFITIFLFLFLIVDSMTELHCGFKCLFWFAIDLSLILFIYYLFC